MALREKKIVFLCVVVIAVLSFPAALFAEAIAYIGEVGGDVKIIKGNPGTGVPATLGMLLEGGDTIKTETESYASVIFQDDGSRVKLGENAQLTLNATRDKKKLKKRMRLEAGKMWAKITKKRGTDFQVSTPTSVASVKGTKFVLEEGNAETLLWVLEDVVEMAIAGGYTVEVSAGEYAKATSKGIEKGTIQDDQIPVEPGKHELIIYLNQQNKGSNQQKELHIDFEH
jgi:hypothetical protein